MTPIQAMSQCTHTWKETAPNSPWDLCALCGEMRRADMVRRDQLTELQRKFDDAQHWRERHCRESEANAKRSAELWEQLQAAEAKNVRSQLEIGLWRGKLAKAEQQIKQMRQDLGVVGDE